MKNLKSVISFLLIVLVLLNFIIFPHSEIKTNAAAINLTTFNQKLTNFKTLYPNNSIFDDEGGKYGGYECFGFANCIAKYMFGSYPTSSGSAISNVDSNWKITYGKTAVDELTIGDVVRFAYGSYDHSIFITSINGSNIYYCQANVPANTNKITYSNSITSTKLKEYLSKKLNGNNEKYGWVAHYKTSILGTNTSNTLTVKWHANGGTIDSQITSLEYNVTESAGLNMRSNAGTNYSVITTIPANSTFTVKYGETKTANGYTWGKTTYAGKTGWVVVSDFVKRTAINRNTDYYLYSSLVYRTSTSSVLAYEMSYGQNLKSGLYNAESFGLKRDGYSFVGWCTKADGSATVFDQDDTTVKPETIYPNLKNQSATITLYAIWKCEHSYSNNCDTECNVCGEVRNIEHAFGGDHICDICRFKKCPSGDTNGDGEVDVMDFIRLKKILIGSAESDGSSPDFDENGVSNAEDLIILKKFLLGVIKSI
ncbi:MAG: SH3 domain-containing protein [Clostridia bacterium]|nr:SH3 domain-containing protein [Clostridia bacterium]